MTTVEIDHRLSSSLFLFFSKNKSVWFGIRCTLDTSSKGDRQRNVRTGEGVGTGKRGGREGEREDTGFPGAADEVLMIGSRQHQLSQLHA